MQASRWSDTFCCAGIGLVAFAVAGAANVQASEPGESPADDIPSADLSADRASSQIKTRICGPRSLRGEFGPAGSIDLLITLRCAQRLALHATSHDGDANHAVPDDAPATKSKWSIHVGRDRVMFTVGTKW